MNVTDQLRTLRRKSLKFLGKSPNTKIQINIPAERHGSVYGGWVIKENSINPASIIYSFGIGNDVTFDLSLINKYKVDIYAFDPTPGVKEWLDLKGLPPQFHHYQIAIAADDGFLKFNKPNTTGHISHSAVLPNAKGDYVEVPAKKLSSIMNELGHTHIDILKMDIEGSEYDVIQNILSSNIKVSQVLIEFHHFFKGIHNNQTENAVSLLNEKGFKIFYISPNGYEYSFYKKN